MRLTEKTEGNLCRQNTLKSEEERIAGDTVQTAVLHRSSSTALYWWLRFPRSSIHSLEVQTWRTRNQSICASSAFGWKRNKTLHTAGCVCYFSRDNKGRQQLLPRVATWTLINQTWTDKTGNVTANQLWNQCAKNERVVTFQCCVGRRGLCLQPILPLVFNLTSKVVVCYEQIGNSVRVCVCGCAWVGGWGNTN